MRLTVSDGEPDTCSNYYSQQLRPAVSSLVIPLDSGSGSLPGTLSVAPVPAGILVVFAHGAGAGRESPFMRRYAALLADRGLDVLTFDFPYMAAGRKLPDRPPALEAAFRRAVEAGMAELAGRARAVVVAGKSLGGRMATHLAAHPEWSAPAPLVAAVAFGYPLKPPGPRGGDRVSHLARLRVPTLIVQGTRDTFGGPDDLQAAADAVGATHITVRAVPTGDHSLAVTAASRLRQADVEHAIADDLVAWLATVAPAANWRDDSSLV